MSSMDFTDEQIMQFVDGEATQDLANKLEKARENNKELNSRIYKFQLANTVMLKHTQEKKEMPELFYARLRKKRIEQEESLDERTNVGFFFRNFGRTAIAASIAAFGVLFATGAYQLQVTSNNNLARDFYSSFEQSDKLQQAISAVKMANVGDFIEKENSLRKKSIDLGSQPIRTLSDSIEGDLGITVYLNKNLTYKLNKGDFVVTGAKLEIQIKGLGNGIVTLIYQDSKGEKQVILDRKPIKRGEVKSLGPYTVIGPEGLDYIQYVFASDDNTKEVQSELIDFTVLRNGEPTLKNEVADFMAVPRSLFSRAVQIQLGNKIIDQSVLSIADDLSDNNNDKNKTATPIWQRNGKFYIDANDNGYANIISSRNSIDNEWRISLDRNNNRIIDGLGTVSVDDNGIYAFRWLLDENEDGVVDKVAIDSDGDWKPEKIYFLYPKGSTFNF